MPVAVITLKTDYWETFKIKESDLEFLYNHLLELETPQTSQELVKALVGNRIEHEKAALSQQHNPSGKMYVPKDHYQVGEKLVFPSLEMKSGKVISVRTGSNPDLPPFEVIEVAMHDHSTHLFASGIEDHVMNNPITIDTDDPNLNVDAVLKAHGQDLIKKLGDVFTKNSDLVCIAGKWFPRALLVDVNIGYLNLAEAVLDVSEGGPLTTEELLKQIELPTDVNSKLTEFSMDLYLQEDSRFDEVGPAGKTLWFLKRAEPAEVREKPDFLKYDPIEVDGSEIQQMLRTLSPETYDELETCDVLDDEIEETTISLIYPHWQSGTLPLTVPLKKLFPTAYETPRIRFTFVDGQTGKMFPGWVVRPNKYVYGLQNWYKTQGLIPGSLVHIRRGEQPGEMIVSTEKCRSSREWIRTVLVGADGGLVFATLKQVVTSAFDERMAIAITHPENLEKMWHSPNHLKAPLSKVVLNTMRELSKLNPQGQIHAQELYAAVNLVRRCPPTPILHLLVNNSWANYLGDSYFRLDDTGQEG